MRRRAVRHLPMPYRKRARAHRRDQAEGAQTPDRGRPAAGLSHGLPDLRQRRRQCVLDTSVRTPACGAPTSERRYHGGRKPIVHGAARERGLSPESLYYAAESLSRGRFASKATEAGPLTWAGPRAGELVMAIGSFKRKV